MSNNEIELFGEILACPRGSGQGSSINIDIRDINRAENRLIEIQSVTKAQAIELKSFLNVTANKLCRLIAFLTKEKNDAIRYQKRIKAIIVLDKMADILKEKGLFKQSNPTGSEDIRDSVLALDPEYDEAVDRINQISAMIMLMEGKRDAIVRGFFSIKDVLDNQIKDGYQEYSQEENKKDF